MSEMELKFWIGYFFVMIPAAIIVTVIFELVRKKQ